MIFESLWGSSQKGELLLLNNGYCRYHVRKDGQLTIYEIISQTKGVGSRLLKRLEHVPLITSVFAKCPINLDSNLWYAKNGFVKETVETLSSGSQVNHWRKPINQIQARPNVRNLEIIFCAGAAKLFSDIALDEGFLLGCRSTEKVTHAPYFVDQNYKNPDFDAYERFLSLYKPHLATVLDWETREQLPEVLRWAEMASHYAQVVIIIPKVTNGIKDLLNEVNGKPVRLGYSVPTRYGGAIDKETGQLVPLEEFATWENGVHLLGGSPHAQMEVYDKLPNVRSLDNSYIKRCAMGAQFWANPKLRLCQSNFFPTLKESGCTTLKDAPLRAFRRSCYNMMNVWKEKPGN